MIRFLLYLGLLQSCYSVCSLCSIDGNAGVDALRHPFDYVDSKGKTCAQLMIELFPLDRHDPVCKSWYESSHERCCGTTLSPQIQQDPPPPSPQYAVDGPYKRCDLCRGGGFPSVTTMVINVLYVGPGTCPQYYEWGQRGWIQDRLCAPIQFFAREACGCITPHLQARELLPKRNCTAKNSTKVMGMMQKCKKKDEFTD